MLQTNSTIDGTTFESNANTNSGAIYFEMFSGKLTITNSKFIKNTSSVGGALYAQHIENTPTAISTIEFESWEFTENTSANVLYLYNSNVFSTLKTKYCKFNENVGSAVKIEYGYYEDYNSTFLGNVAEIGAGILMQSYANVSLDSTYFGLNNATRSGGAVYCMLTSNLNATSTTFIENIASEKGGALFME
jgi:predicted outer membrane repeat protein